MSGPSRPIGDDASLSINKIIEAANKNDRFKLFNDDSVLPCDLDNAIHPIFHDANFLEPKSNMKQALQLASMMLLHDTVLEFYVPILLNKTLTEATGKKRTYLIDPLVNKSFDETKAHIREVRRALHCLAHCVTFRFTEFGSERRIWARTTKRTLKLPYSSESCTPLFQKHTSVMMELTKKWQDFYLAEDGYAKSSHCDQLRHDFFVAITIMHEITHAFGVMRRGHLDEPWIRLDYPDYEMGYAWENFMFGAILDPRNRSVPGTHVLTRKFWSKCDTAHKAGGKQYDLVPMSYIGQWFRRSTWALIESQGPLAIPPPTIQLRIQSHRKYGAWVVFSDVQESETDITQLRNKWRKRLQQLGTELSDDEKSLSEVMWKLAEPDGLQKQNVPMPLRRPKRQPRELMSVAAYPKRSNTVAPIPLALQVCPATCPITAVKATVQQSNVRKRPSDPSDDSDRPNKVTKRLFIPF